MTRTRWSIAFLMVSVLVSACGARAPSSAAPGAEVEEPSGAGAAQEPAGPGDHLLNPAELAQMLTDKDFFFVNTHIPYEGEIEGTDAFIPYDQIGENLASFPGDRDARIVLYCRSGRMSAIAAETLADLGYTNVWDLEGGMIAWQDAGFALAGE